MLLHHSAGGNLHRWRAWVPTLARSGPVIRFDMRGHAGTPPPPDLRFSLSDLAIDIARVMDGLGIGKAHLVGASAGGIISLRFAHDFPDRLHSLTLVASTPRLARMGAGMDAAAWQRTLERGHPGVAAHGRGQEIRARCSPGGHRVVRGLGGQDFRFGCAGPSDLPLGG